MEADNEFVHEDDGRVTARHVESGVASFWATEFEALRALADALESHRGNGESIDDPDADLDALGIDVEDAALLQLRTSCRLMIGAEA